LKTARPRVRPALAACLLALVVLALAPLGCGDRSRGPFQGYDADGRARPPQRLDGARPNVLLIVLDTLRADAIQPDAGADARMPFLSGLARRSAWFPQACSTSSWTLPALASLLTGVEPSEHLLVREDQLFRRPGALVTLPEILRASAGYATAGFYGGLGPVHHAALAQGLDQTGNTFVAHAAEAALGPWETARAPGKPWFLLLHSYEAHDPYGRHNHPAGPVVPTAEERASVAALGLEPKPEEVARRVLLSAGQRALFLGAAGLRHQGQVLARFTWDGLRDHPQSDLPDTLRKAYWAGVRELDDALRVLFERLATWGLLENTLWIITSDHGEAFGEHGILVHGRRLDDELVRVPLIVGGRAPFDVPRAWPGSVSLLDLLPTVLEAVGLPQPPNAVGRSLLAEAVRLDADRLVPFEVLCSPQMTGDETVDIDRMGLRSARWKYVANLDRRTGAVEEEAFDLAADPGERQDLLAPGASTATLSWPAAAGAAAMRTRARVLSTAPRVDIGPAHPGR
jgi:arylsulfatase A-like enzyme